MRVAKLFMATLLAAGALVCGSAAAQVVMLNGKATNYADSNTGRLLTVISAHSGGARVAVTTDPAVALVCDNKEPVTTCSAWVHAGSRVAVTLRRPDSARTPIGGGLTPTIRQWRADCAGATAPTCVVKMDANRTVEVDWGR